MTKNDNSLAPQPMSKVTISTYSRSRDIPPEVTGDNLFHSRELFTICERTPGYTPLLFVAWRDGKAVGKLLGVIRKSIRLFPPSLIRRCEVYGTGEYAPGEHAESLFRLLLGELTRTALSRCFLIEFRNLSNPLFAYREFRQNKYFPINWLRIHNSLHSKPPMERMSASRRRQIKRALACGASIHVARSMEEVQEFFHLLRKYYASKIRKHFPGMNFFLQLVREYPDREIGRIYIIRYKEKVIGGSVCVFSGGNAYLWFSAGLRKSYPRQCPGVLAVWAAIDYAYRHGYDHIEFMDVGLPFQQYGYRNFILRFGGIQYGTRRWFRFRWNWLNRLITRFYI